MAKDTSILNKALKREIRLDLIAQVVWKNRLKYIIPLGITFVVAVIIALSIPRYYRVQVMLAPEYSSGSSLSSLSGIASMVGMNMGNLTSEDAIIPQFYPDLIKSTDFVTGLFNSKVKTQDNSFNGPMSEYIAKHQKAPWWDMMLGFVKNLFKKPATGMRKGESINPFNLTKPETDIADAISGSISCTVDKKTDVISISIVGQDPLATAMFADSVKSHLQEFITVYRTKKARNDMNHVELLYRQAYHEYLKKQQVYAGFSDANQDLVSPAMKIKESDLENEMQLAYNTYSQVAQQLQLSRAKLLERTPAFTTIQNATVPIKPAGPKRMVMVAMYLIIVFFAETFYLCRKEKTSETKEEEK